MRKATSLAFVFLLCSGLLLGALPGAQAASVEKVGTLPLPLVGSSAVFVNGVTYVFGGRTTNSLYSEDILRYDHATNEVTKVATMPKVTGTESGGRQAGAAVLVNGKILYFGGAAIVEQDINNDGTKERIPKALRDIFEFDPATNGVTPLPETLPSGIWGLQPAQANGKVYLFGGFSFDITNPTDIARRDWILRFDPAALPGTRMRQDPVSRLPFPVQDGAVANLGSMIYYFGGLSDNDNQTNPCPMATDERRMATCTTMKILAFSPSSESFFGIVGDMPYRAQFLHAAVIGGKAYIPGGRLTDGSATATILEFNPNLPNPTREVPVPLPKGQFAAPVVTDGLTFTLFGGRLAGLADLSADILRYDPRPSAPRAPASLSATVGPGGAKLVWEPPTYDGDSPVTAYRVYRQAPGAPEALLKEVSTLSYEDATARPGIEYVYRVTSVNAIGESSSSAKASLTTGVTVPGPIQSLAVYPGNAEVLVRWSPPAETGGSNITGYRVYRDGARSFPLPPTTLEFRDTGLENGRTYAYEVRAVNVKGESAAGKVVRVTTAPVPAAPQLFDPDPQPAGVHLTWEAPPAGVQSYVVLRGVTPTDIAPVANVTETTYVDANVLRGRTYYYAIAASNEAGVSPPSDIRQVSLVSKPGAPQNVFAAPLEGAVRLTWQPPTDTGEAPREDVRYYVSRANDGSRAFSIIATDLVETYYEDRSLLPGRNFTYTVTALNPIASDPSAPVRAAAKAVVNKPPVAALSALPTIVNAGDPVTLDASQSADEDGLVKTYVFDFGDGSPPKTSEVPTLTHQYKANGSYVATVKVTDNRGDTSEEAEATILVGEPDEHTSDNGGLNTPGRSTGAPPGSGSPKSPIPGPGALLVVAAVAGLALLARHRRG